MPATGASTGSSPRVRGTLAAQGGVAAVGGIIPACAGTPCYRRRGSDRNGIIPACAGNTGRRCGCHEHVRDHPRVCGEHPFSSIVHNPPGGSSPRVRGTRGHARCFEGRAGIIPACAGNTCKVSSSVFSAWDHPRVCGEHKPRRRQPTARPGSSPRVRGTPWPTWATASPTGIIPACAGNTHDLGANRRCRGDHPRVCGEHVS